MTTPSQRPLFSIRIMHWVFVASMFVIGVVSWFLFDSHDYPPTWVPWALGALALGVGLYCRYVVPSIVRPIAGDTDPGAAQQQAVRSFQSAVIMQLAAAQTPGILAFALGFIEPHRSIWTPIIGIVLSLIVLLTIARPDRAQAERIERRLDSAGARSELVSTLFGGPSPSSSGFGGIRMH